MLENIKSTCNKAAYSFKKGLEEFERASETFLRQLSEFRYVFYTLCFYLIINSYSDNNFFKFCGVLFVLYSFVDLIIRKSKVNPKVKYHSITAMNACLIIATLITTFCISQSLVFFYNNYSSLFKSAKNFVFKHPTTLRRLFNFAKIISIPISAMCTVYYKYIQYLKLPSYKQMPQQVNVLNGSSISTDIMRENIKMPVLQLISLVVNAVTSKNPISVVITLLDILFVFTNYAGHKHRFFYYPMVLTSAINLFMGFANICDVLKHNWMIDALKA